MSPRRKEPKTVPMVWVIGIAIPILTFLGGMLANAWSIAGNIATKSELGDLRKEVVEGFKKTDDAIAKMGEASRKYAEEQSATSLNKAVDHSDFNHKDMELKLQANISDQKTTQAQIAAIGKQLDTVQNLIMSGYQKKK